MNEWLNDLNSMNTWAEEMLGHQNYQAYQEYLTAKVCASVGMPPETLGLLLKDSNEIHIKQTKRFNAAAFDCLTRMGYKLNLLTGEYYR